MHFLLCPLSSHLIFVTMNEKEDCILLLLLWPPSHNALCQAWKVGCLKKKLKHSSNRIFFHNFLPSTVKHHNMSNNKLTLSGVCNVWLCSRGETPLQNCNTKYTNKFGPRNENMVVKSRRKNTWYDLLSTSQNQMAKQTSLLELKQWQHHCAMLSFLTLFSEKPAPIRILILQDYIHTYIIKVSFHGHALK